MPSSVAAALVLLPALFAAKGHVWWQLGLAMAVANVLGSLPGSKMALRHGAGFVRGAFLVVVGALILRIAYDTWLRQAAKPVWPSTGSVTASPCFPADRSVGGGRSRAPAVA